ncbi:MAG: amidohydrolase family protein, partial [Nonomuraea sp.]|nr:amidohydrolase family protein [Nonomuraea sp.]
VLALLDDGTPVALGTNDLGTDGLGNDRDLARGGGRGGDVLALAAVVRERARQLGLRVRGLDRRLVEAATMGGARALGMDRGPGRIGSLGPGSRADFAVYDARGRYPYSALMARPPCLATVVGGTVRGLT